MDLKQSDNEGKIKGVLSTPKGKGVVAGLSLVIIVLLVLLVATFAIPQLDDSAEVVVNKEVVKSLDKTPQMPVAQTPVQPTNGTTVTATGTANDETESVKYSEEIMKFRDPFAPIIESTTTSGSEAEYSASSNANQSTTSDDASNGSTSGSTGDANNGSSNSSGDGGAEGGSGDTGGTNGSGNISNKIILNAITTESGIRYGVFLYNGVQYVAKAGDVIGSSSYQVLDVGDGSATLVYGDDRVTISLGEEIVK